MKRIISISAAALMTLALAAPVAAQDTAMVRVLHGSPDAPAVDVYLDGTRVGDPLANLEFGDLTAYVPVPAGDHAIRVCAAGDDSVCPIDVPSVSLAANTAYTIAATNSLEQIEAQVVEDSSATDAQGARARVVHFSADTPAIDVLTQDGAATVVEALEYPNATDYLSLDPGAYDLKVCAADDAATCPLDPGTLQLEAGQSYSVFAIGSLEGETLTAAVGIDSAAMPSTAMAVPASMPGILALAGTALLTAGAWLGLVAIRERR